MLSNLLADWFWDSIVQKKKTVSVVGDKFTGSELVEQYNNFFYSLMVKDRVRMEAYRQAIHKYAPDKVVLEIGTGALAPLARMCIEAGAKKVYAIEGDPVAVKQAREGLQRDGLQSKIEVVEGLSEDIECLPEKADLLVHELIGIHGSDEGMARIVDDAKKKFLKENAMFIPSSCRVAVAPVTWKHVNSWLGRTYEFLMYWPNRNAKIDPNRYFIWNFPTNRFLTEPLEQENIIFASEIFLEETREIKFLITRHSTFNGFLFWSEIVVGENKNVINCIEGTCWPAMFIPFCQEPLELLPEDILIMESYEDLRINPQYQFKVYLIRGEEKREIGVKRVGSNN